MTSSAPIRKRHCLKEHPLLFWQRPGLDPGKCHVNLLNLSTITHVIGSWKPYFPGTGDACTWPPSERYNILLRPVCVVYTIIYWSRAWVLYFINTEAFERCANFGVGKNRVPITLGCGSDVHPTCECMQRLQLDRCVVQITTGVRTQNKSIWIEMYKICRPVWK